MSSTLIPVITQVKALLSHIPHPFSLCGLDFYVAIGVYP